MKLFQRQISIFHSIMYPFLLGEHSLHGETGMGKRGGVEVLARAGSWEGETGRVRTRRGQWGGGGGNGKGEMGRGQQEWGDREGGKWEEEKKGREERRFHRWIWWNVWVDIWNAWVEWGYRLFWLCLPMHRWVPQLVAYKAGIKLRIMQRPVKWREIFMKQSVSKCKQISF